MRAILVLATLSLLTFALPLAAADHAGKYPCDVDDDLYQHCHVGPVHWVTGPLCAGVAVGHAAECVDLRRLLA